eukprot:2374050-Prymnesium_polylepis.1
MVYSLDPPVGAPVNCKHALRPLRPSHRKPAADTRDAADSSFYHLQLLTLMLAFRSPGTRMGALMFITLKDSPAQADVRIL